MNNEFLLCNAYASLGASSMQDFKELYPFNISLHAAEDEGRSEEPTEHKKRKARDEEGRVFLTQELPGSLVVMITFTTIFILAVYIQSAMSYFVVDFMSNPTGTIFTREELGLLVKNCVVVFFENIYTNWHYCYIGSCDLYYATNGLACFYKEFTI